MKNIDYIDRFSPKVKDFFNNLELNNNKEWFDSNRSFYEKEIRDKSKGLIANISNEFIQNNLKYYSDNKLSLFRINRDIRFSPNKNPYKTNLGLYFPYSHSINQINKDYNLGLYFHFESDASFIAIGMHNPDSTNLKLIRKKIAESYHDYESIINNNEFKQVFTDNYSTNNLLTRVAGYDKNHPAIEYLKQKEFTYGAKISDDVFFDGTLLENIINTARVGVDYCEYIFEAIN